MARYHKTVVLTLAVAAGLAVTVNAHAASVADFGSNITVYDNKVTADSGWGGSDSRGQGKEDNETEPETTASQAWDLEGAFLNHNTLTLVGGYNFFNTSGGDWRPGDLFFNTVGPITEAGGDNLQEGNKIVTNTFGYEYALDVDWRNLRFDAILLNATSKTITVNYQATAQDAPGPGPGSNPWKYYSGGVKVGTGVVANLGAMSDVESGFSDWGTAGDANHYAVSFDLTDFFSVAVLSGKEFDVHVTMACGNDNLMAHRTAPVPEPATMLLFGTGLAGLAGLVRGRKK